MIYQIDQPQINISIRILFTVNSINKTQIIIMLLQEYYHKLLLYQININIFQMLSEVDKYRQMIKDKTQRIILFPYMDNSQKRPIVTFQCNIELPSSHPFRSSQQIDNNVPITHHINHQSSKQYPTQIQNQWPQSCIGLILCEHHQSNQTFYVYGTGILIHRNIVLTSAQNVYCRRLNTQYTNIRFIVSVSGDKCSGIYDVDRIYYPKEYTMQGYDNNNFAVLQLYDDLSNKYGYVGLKKMGNMEMDEKYTEYGYTSGNKEGSFKLRVRTKHQKLQQGCLEYSHETGVLIKESDNKCFIVGMKHSERKYFLNEKIRNIINQWTQITTIDLAYNNINAQGCKYLSQANWKHLKQINLRNNNIDAQACKYLSQINCTKLIKISLYGNNIDTEGCKYLSLANWIHLTMINLQTNNIGTQGCKYLSRSNWRHLIQIDLCNHGIIILGQGCKYLSRANWKHLNTIDLSSNNIGTQGCKYLSQASWRNLTTIHLSYNNINAQGCKYLSQTNWKHLTSIYLDENSISIQG